MKQEDYDSIDVYCLRCKKEGKMRDLRKPDGSYPFVYDGCYECDECKSKSQTSINITEKNSHLVAERDALKEELAVTKKALEIACETTHMCPDAYGHMKCPNPDSDNREDCTDCKKDYFIKEAKSSDSLKEES